jgi:hypothetical protein
LLVYDLRAEQAAPPAPLPGKRIKVARGVAEGSSIVGVCASGSFDLVDLRIRDAIMSLGIEGTPIDFRVVDPTKPAFLVCSDTGLLRLFDVRNAGKQAKRLRLRAAAQALSFDTRGAVCVVGHTAGIVMADVANDKQIVVAGSHGWFGTGIEMKDVENVLFHPTKQFALVAQYGRKNIGVLSEARYDTR